MVTVNARRSWLPIAAATAVLALAALLLVAPETQAVRVLESPGDLPDRVHAYGSAQIGEDIYLVGGGRGQAYLDEITHVTPDGTANTVASLPTPLKSPAAVAHDGAVYIFGGAERSSDDLPETTSAIHRFDPQTGEVEEISGASLPDPVSSASAVTIDDTIYVLGGLSIQPSQEDEIDFVTTIAAFDPGEEEVTELDAQLPTGRAQAAAVALGGQVLYAGGHAEQGGGACPEELSTCFVTDVLRFRPEAGRVEHVGDLAEPLRWSAAAVHEDTAYVMGGCRANCGPHHGSSAIHAIDTTTDQVSQLPVTMPVTGGRNSALLHDGVAWLPGGVRASQDGSHDHIRILRVELGATRPWAPVNLSAQPVPDGVQLAWDPPEYDGGDPVTGYVVERAQGARDPVRLDRVTEPSFRDLNATQGVSYTYQVRAENTRGISSPGGQVPIRPTQTPQAPAVSAQGGDGKLVVQWEAPEDTGGLAVESYRVFAYAPGSQVDLDRCASACWGTVSNTTTRASISTVQEDPVTNGDTYEIRVQARNANGWGEASPAQQVTARPVPDAPTNLHAQASEDGDRSVELAWQAPEDDEAVSGFVVYRGPVLDELAEIDRTEDTTFRDTSDVPEGQRILYAIAARNGDAQSPLSQPASVVFPTPPGAVGDLSARWTGSYVDVSWSAPNETGGQPVQAYEVARTEGAMDPEEAEADVQRTATQGYQDNSPPRGGPVSYHVRAVTDAGEGPWTFEQIRIPHNQESRPPVPALAAHPTKIDAGGRVVFDAGGSQDDEDVVAYNFSFGDGDGTGWRSSPRATHTYTEEGVYEAIVTVRDASGLEAIGQATIAVGPPQQDDANDTVDGGLEDPPDETDDAPLPTAIALLAVLGTALLRTRRGR